MRCCTRFLIVALAFSLALAALHAADEADGIRAAFSALLSGNNTPERTQKDLLILVETLGQMADRSEGIPANARVKIREAVAAFRKNSSIDGPAVLALHSAWQAFSGGKPFSFPQEVKDPPSASKAIQSRVDSCVKAIQARDDAKAVKDLLDAVLMVATPLPMNAL